MQVKGKVDKPTSFGSFPSSAYHQKRNFTLTDNVADYLQVLSDDNRIHVEKIGSGNWYWSFALQELKARQAGRDAAQATHSKQLAAVEDLRARHAEAIAQRKDEEAAMATAAGEHEHNQDPDGSDQTDSRETLLARQSVLIAETAALRTHLAAYSDDDPFLLQDKKAQTHNLANQARAYTDDIYSLESWFRRMGADEHLAALRATFYGSELDAESGQLRDLD
jgi:hypothetical protein